MNQFSTLKYPIGIQDFASLREDGYLYIDKTALIYKLVNTGRYYFFSRPRRFGKSMLISTLEAYFLGKKELFKGLAIEKLEQDWTPRPVLHLDLNTGLYTDEQALIDTLDETLSRWEAIYGASETERNVGLRFKGVVQRAYEKTGERVAILIDEYDKPLLQNVGNVDMQEKLRDILRLFYSVIKTQDRYIKFGLLTGVTKFCKLSVFSDLNSPEDISTSRNWATLCGITEEEIMDNLQSAIEELASVNGMTYDEAFATLKKKYDGYHFYQDSIGVYNPYSLLNALKNNTFGNYWFETGTPLFLVKLMQKTNYNLNNLADERQTADLLNSVDSVEVNPVPFLYQSGYLTIKGYDDEFNEYILGFPNDEVENGFVNYLFPCYVSMQERTTAFFIAKFVRDVRTGNIDSFMQRLQALFADNSYQIQGEMELYFQSTMYVIFKLMGFYVDVERTTSIGRIDMVMKTNGYIYIIEIKLDGSADDALKQIDDRQYAAPYTSDTRKLFKVGVNFSSDIRGVKESKVK